MKQTNITHNIRVDKNQSNRKVYEAWNGNEWLTSDPNKEYVPVQDFGMAMCNRKRGKRR